MSRPAVNDSIRLEDIYTTHDNYTSLYGSLVKRFELVSVEQLTQNENQTLQFYSFDKGNFLISSSDLWDHGKYKFRVKMYVDNTGSGYGGWSTTSSITVQMYDPCYDTVLIPSITEVQLQLFNIIGQPQL